MGKTNSNKKQSPEVCAFDFDGTLTTSDTLLDLLLYRCKRRGYLALLLRFLPLLVLTKLGLYPADQMKERLFSFLFFALPEKDMDDFCNTFATAHQHVLRPEAMAEARQAISRGAKVVVVTASCEQWVRPMLSRQLPEAVVVGTRWQLLDGHTTGRLDTPNCNGAEKVRRLQQLFPDRSSYRLVAYGDSKGDRALLDYADEAHYKPFTPKATVTFHPYKQQP